MVPRRPDSVDIDVGERIKSHRLAAGLSQTELANGIGVTFQQVQKYEKGANRVAAGRLTRIAHVLQIPVMVLYEGTDHSPRTKTREAKSLISLLIQPDALRLLKAYSRIDDGLLRLNVVQMVEGIAVKTTGQPRRKRRYMLRADKLF